MNITASMVKELREKTAAGMLDCKKALAEAEGNMDRAIDLLREKGLAKAAKKSDRIAAEGLVGVAISEDGKKASMVEVNSETDFVAKNEEFIGFVDNIAKIALENNPSNLDELLASSYENEGTVKDALNAKIARIGENMSIRRFSVLSVDSGRIADYVHGAGKIAVLVKMQASNDSEKLETLGKDIAMQMAAMNPKYISRDDVDPEYIAHEKEILIQQALNEGKPQNIVEKMVEGRLQKQLKEVCLLDQTFVKDSDKTVQDVVNETSKEIGSEIKLTDVVRFEVGEGIEKKEENFAEEVAKQLGN
ncbi:elongation factor Ts [Acetoanaerobium pronyense]|uniref:Elongation factor Ts n=1 Tax=Acetoanaerobium pronyense TaxID=1482736 RepID=A0ABS4KGE8_9FIRM|nr:translation elongation factor Ts [Acetoanaerobium pronyense]MBP2026430.1 elongation factor Ts [Acetoanaerobium pronyense]